MADITGETRATVGATITNEVSRRQTFYVAEIAGEHYKYDLDRDFVTSKNSPYSLSTDDFEVGAVYEIKDDREGLRAYFQVDAVDADATLPIDLTVIAADPNPDTDAVLDVVAGDRSAADVDGGTDGGTTPAASLDGRAADIAQQLADADEETIDRVMALLDAEENGETAADHTRVSLSNVPAGVRQKAKTHRSAFSAAFEKHTGESASPLLEAVASDAAILALRSE